MLLVRGQEEKQRAKFKSEVDQEGLCTVWRGAAVGSTNRFQQGNPGITPKECVLEDFLWRYKSLILFDAVGAFFVCVWFFVLFCYFL